MTNWWNEIHAEEGWVHDEPPLPLSPALSPEAEKALEMIRASMAELATQRCGRESERGSCCGGRCQR